MTDGLDFDAFGEDPLSEKEHRVIRIAGKVYRIAKAMDPDLQYAIVEDSRPRLAEAAFIMGFAAAALNPELLDGDDYDTIH